MMLNDVDDISTNGSPSPSHPLKQAKSFSFGRSMIPPPTLGAPIPVQVIDRVGTPVGDENRSSNARSSSAIGGGAAGSSSSASASITSAATAAAAALLPIAFLGRRRASKDSAGSDEQPIGRAYPLASPLNSRRPSVEDTMSISSPAAAFAAKFGAARSSSASTGRPTSAGNASGQTSQPSSSRNSPATSGHPADASLRSTPTTGDTSEMMNNTSSPIEPSTTSMPSSKSRLGFGFTKRSRRAREAAQAARSDTPSSSDDGTEDFGQENSTDSIDPLRGGAYDERYGADQELSRAPLDGYSLEPSGRELRDFEMPPRWDPTTQNSPATSSANKTGGGGGGGGGGWPRLRSKSSNTGPLPIASASTSTSSRHAISKVSVQPSALPEIPYQQGHHAHFDEGITPTRSTMDEEADALFKTPTGARTVRSGSNAAAGKQRPELRLPIDGMSRSASMPLSPGSSSAPQVERIVLGPALPTRSAARSAAAKENVELLNLTIKTRPGREEASDLDNRRKDASIPEMVAVPARKSSRSLRLNADNNNDGSQDRSRIQFPGDTSTADEMPAMPDGSRERSRKSSRTEALRDNGEASATNSDSPAIEGYSREKSRSSKHHRDKSQARTDVEGGLATAPTSRHRSKDKGARTLSLPNANDVVPSRMGLYVYPQPQSGRAPDRPLRAHSGTLVGDKIYVIGGSDKSGCWPGVATFDTETYIWETLETRGEIRKPLRAHTTTLVDNILYVFGGGDGPEYANEVWAFDTTTNEWKRPQIDTPVSAWPVPRRAHTAVLFRHYVVICGGGNGHTALNDVWALNVSDPEHLTWEEWKATGDLPVCKGYHSANLVDHKMVIYGGSDGHKSFADVHVLDLETLIWTKVDTGRRFSRLSHTSTLIGSYLFVLGGHDGHKYSQDLLLLNLVTLDWETKPLAGHIPVGRGYHFTVLHDSRLFLHGGYNGVNHFDDMHCFELAMHAYLPQVTTFDIDEAAKRLLE